MNLKEVKDFSSWKNVEHLVEEEVRSKMPFWNLFGKRLCEEAAAFVEIKRLTLDAKEQAVKNTLKGVEIALKADSPNDYFTFLQKVSGSPSRLGKMLKWTEFFANRKKLVERLDEDLEDVTASDKIQHWEEVARRAFARGGRSPKLHGSYRTMGIKQTADAFAIPLQDLRDAAAKRETNYNKGVLFEYLAERGLLLNKDAGENVKAYVLTRIRKEEPCVVVATRNRDLLVPKYVRTGEDHDALAIPEISFSSRKFLYEEFIENTFYRHVSNSVYDGFDGHLHIKMAYHIDRADELFKKHTGLSLGEVAQPFVDPAED